MEAVASSETSGNFYHLTQCNIPEGNTQKNYICFFIYVLFPVLVSMYFYYSYIRKHKYDLKVCDDGMLIKLLMCWVLSIAPFFLFKNNVSER
jgi:hypothetical protein